MQPTRRQIRSTILSDIGITTWRLRAAPGSAAPAAPDSAAPDSAAPDSAALDVPPQAGNSKPVMRSERSVPAMRPPAQEASLTPPSSAATASPPPARAEAPWSVVSLALSGTLLLVSGDSSRRDLRLARDILSAAVGDWRSRPARRDFRWPPEIAGHGLAPSPDAGRRALAAFIDKDVSDHGVGLLLCTHSVAARFPSGWQGCRLLPMPELPELGRDPDAKRALWGALAETRG